VISSFGPDEGICARCGVIGKFSYGISRDSDSAMMGCEPCDFNTRGGRDNPEEEGLISPYTPHKGMIDVYGKNYEIYTNNIITAATRARSARFEHGESP